MTQSQSSLNIKCPDESNVSAAFSGGNLIRATSPDGDTVTYSYTDVSGYKLVSSVVSSYGDKIEVGYDSSWRVKTVKRYVGENLCNVLSLSYNEGSTAVSSVDYISSKPVGEIKTGYVFSRDGKLLSEFEINDGSSLASALDAKFVSDTDYERYVYSLNPSLCRKGELYAETQNETVGYFSVTASSKQERYVLYARIDSQSVFDGIENGYVDIAVALTDLRAIPLLPFRSARTAVIFRLRVAP